ncbi:transglutaminase domain-containing protein, partial [Endozoicomonas sp. SESOKO3]|uniref:transglutaminase domain-containing protein n=2 Tax=unclassified Endozoicomonas TaxID=2644528 RepID=UPI0021477C08
LIDSEHLEGELNDILAGDAHPGFHLFATINPPEYSGRKPLSPALKGRFRHLPIRQYSQEELQTIAGKVLPQTPQGKIIAEHLTEIHCRLRVYLQQKKLPLQPTSLDLQNVARAVIQVIQGGDFTEEELHRCLNQHYRLYLMAAEISLEKLPEPLALAMGNSALDYRLCHWFNQMVSDTDRPWVVGRGDLNSIDEKRHEICIKTRLSKEEARTEIIRMVAQTRWQASGLSLKPDQSDDMLTQSLYRHWQQRWFNHGFSQTGVDVNSVFPLTKEQEQTLKTPACQPYLRETDRRLEAWNANEFQLCPALWHQISDLPNHLMNDFIKEASAGSDDAPEPGIPEALEKEAEALDRTTNYEALEIPKGEIHKIFDTQNHSPRMYRWRAKHVYVTVEGDIKKINLDSHHLLGIETLIPDPLPEYGQEIALTGDQTLASLELSSENGEYPLPSLTPHDAIVALRIEHGLPFKLIRDRYTGLYTLFIPQAKAHQSIQCTYVVEPGKPGGNARAKEVRPGRSIPFDAQCTEGMKNVLKELFTNIDRHPTEMKALLRTINDTKDTRQRINAITEYCKQFSGDAEPEAKENFFRFLVTRRQGSCRHRVPVFIAFCRYFGISCREISSRVHCFAEYSVDRGQTWESVDLDGAPDGTTEITPAFQPTRKVPASSGESKKTLHLLKELLKGADLAQQQTLAKACGMSLKELNNAFVANTALPKTNLSTFEIVRNLWKEKNLTGFSMGFSMLELLETKTLSCFVEECIDFLVCDDSHLHNPLPEAVRQILSNSDEDQVTGKLKFLHSKMIVQGGVSPTHWLRLIVDILKHIDLTRPSVIQFARKTLESCWLDSPPIYKGHIVGAHQQHQILVRLEDVDELKVEAAHSLKKWYRMFLSREKNSQIWRLVYRKYQNINDEAWFVTHCHEGFSPFLEGKITRSSLQIAWTGEPQGVPNVERMLVHQPAFSKLNSGKENHRPVIILGRPLWEGIIWKKINVLCDREVESSPDLKQLSEKIKLNACDVSWWDQRLLDDLKFKYKLAIQLAFSYYLYEMTHSKSGSLTYCWVNASMADTISIERYVDNYGAHDPSSPEELFAMMHEIISPHRLERTLRDTHLRQALNASNALVLKPNELTIIAEEFLNSVNLNSIYDSLM